MAGLSPAVVTETLYALAVKRRPAIIPKRVCIITTEDAYGQLVSTLLGSGGRIRRMVREYGLPQHAMRCTHEDIFVVQSKSGRPLEDIRSSSDSRAAGETIARILSDLRSDPDVELHCSLAGGRKTMGALMALALQLIARPSDRLYHVLVNEPFERIREFYYPPRRPCYYDLNGERIDSRKARIDLAEVPFIRMGSIAETLGIGTEDLIRRTAMIQNAMDCAFKCPFIDVDRSRRAIRIGAAQVRLPPQEFILYFLHAFLRRNCASCARMHAGGCAACHPSDQEIFDVHRLTLLADYRQLREAEDTRLHAILSHQGGAEKIWIDFNDWLRQTRSKLNRRIRQKLCHPSAFLRIWKSGDSDDRNRRGLCLPPSHIRIRNVESSGR